MGKRIGKYELGRTLGHGNYSKVKLGIDIETDTKWAVKIIDKEQLHREHMEEQLKREIAVMKALNHDNIVQLREVMQTQNHIYLVLELSTGGELFDKIVQAKRFDEPTARRYFQQLVLGLRYAHSQGIAHRDIKPENLLLDADGALKISDFGLSNLQPADGKALLQTVCGTPNYVAPEVLKERGYNGFLADAWSCGVVLFVMLAGYLPFDDQNVNALFNKIERGDYRMARNFSEPVRDIISRLLTVDPAQRLSMDGILDHPWFREGLDAATIQRARGHDQFVPTQQQLDAAITDSKEMESADTVEVPAGFIAAVDGLELVGHLVATSLQPYAAPGIDATYGACGTVRRFVVADRNAPAELNAILAALKGCPRLSGNELRGFINSISHGLVTFRATFTLMPGDLVLVEFLRLRGSIPVFLQLVDDVAGKLAVKGTLRSQLTRVDPILVA